MNTGQTGPEPDEPGTTPGEMYTEDDAEDREDGTGAGADVATENMRELVIFIASQLVSRPDDVEVQAERRGAAVHLRLRVPPEELGKVIGRQGRVARAMRTALTIAGSRHNLRTSFDIED